MSTLLAEHTKHLPHQPKMSTWRPQRYAWKNLPPGEIPEIFRDIDDENAYYDHIALQEYETSTTRQFILALSRRRPLQIRPISLEKLLWLLPDLAGSTTMSTKGKRELDDSLEVVARTVVVECCGYITTERNAPILEQLLTARNKDPLCLFLARLLNVPNIAISETSCSVLVNLVRAPGRASLRDLSSMDMGAMTKLLIKRIYLVFENGTKENVKKEIWEIDDNEEDANAASNGSGMTKVAHTQGFHMLCILNELILVPKALPWIRHGIVQLVPTLLNTLVPNGAHDSFVLVPESKKDGKNEGKGEGEGEEKMGEEEKAMGNEGNGAISLMHSTSCRDLDSFETLCHILTNLAHDDASAKLMRDAGFVETWIWMLRERRKNGDGKDFNETSCSKYNIDGNLEEDEHQRRVVRSFFDVLWEWTYSTVLTVKVRDIFMVSLSQTIEHEEEMEDMKETTGEWIEDEIDIVTRRLHQSSDLVMQACGILWNCLDSKEDVIELEEDLLQRGIIDRLSQILLKSQDCGVLTCCAGALRNIIQTNSLTFHVSSQEGLVEHLKHLKIQKNAEELVHDQKDRLLGDPALRYRDAAEKPTAGLAASALSIHSKTSDLVRMLTKACDLVLRRLMGDEDEDESGIAMRWGK